MRSVAAMAGGGPNGNVVLISHIYANRLQARSGEIKLMHSEMISCINKFTMKMFRTDMNYAQGAQDAQPVYVSFSNSNSNTL